MSMDIAAANRVADNQPDNDPSDESGQCTLTQKDMQLVPVRYAMVEEPEAERAEEVDGFAPVHGGRFRRSGIRPIRSGWLYIVHSLAPDELLIFKVEPDGSGDEIILERKGSIEVLHSMVELTELHQSMLLIPTFRRQVMTRVGIGGFCHGTAHLLDPNDLPDALADDHGEYRATPEAPDHEAGADAEIDPGSYAWCDLEATPTGWQAASAGEIVGSIKGSYQNDSAILVVEDIPARVTDWAQLWKELSEQQGDWQDKYQTENFAARTIENLMNLNFAPHAANAGQGNIPEWLGDAGSDDQADLRELADLYEQRRERREAIHTAHTGVINDALGPINRDIDELSQHIAENLGTDAESVKEFVEKTEQAHFNEVIGGNYALAPNGIVDVIRQQDMENFLAYTNGLQEDWQTAYQAVGHELAQLLSAWHDYALLMDREEEDHIIFTSLLEKSAVETLAFCGQKDFLAQYYMGDTPNTAHLMHYVPTESFINDFLSDIGGPQKALMEISALVGASGALSDFEEWRDTIERRASLRFRSVEGLSEKAAAAVAGEIDYKEKLLGEKVTRRIINDTLELNLDQRLDRLGASLTSGERLIFVDSIGTSELGFKIPDQTILERLRNAIRNAETASSEIKKLVERLPVFYRQRDVRISGARADVYSRRTSEQFNARPLREISAGLTVQKRLLREALDEIRYFSFPVNKQNKGFVRAGGISWRSTQAAFAEVEANKRIANQSHENVMRELDSLIQNERGEVSLSRAISVIANGTLSMLGGILFCVAIKELINNKDDRVAEYTLNALSQLAGTFSSLMAVREVMVETRHRKLFKGLHRADNTLRAAAGSPAQLERWASAANKAISWVTLLGGASATFELIKQVQKLKRADTQSERVATQMAIIGATGMATGLTGTGLITPLGRYFGVNSVTLRGLLLGVSTPVSWFVAVSTLVYIVGDILASRFSLSPVQGWCQRSYWGKKNEYENLEKHKNELSKLSGHKAIIQRQGVASSHPGPGYGPPAQDVAFRLSLPGRQLPNAENLSFGVWGVYRGEDSLRDFTQDVLTHSAVGVLGDGDGGVTYHFPPQAMQDLMCLRLVVLTELNEASSTQVYELYKRGWSLPGEWREINELTDDSFSVRTPGSWPGMPLEPWTTE